MQEVPAGKRTVLTMENCKHSNQDTHQGISVSNTVLIVWDLEPNQCIHYGQDNTLRKKYKENGQRPIDLKENTKLSNL